MDTISPSQPTQNFFSKIKNKFVSMDSKARSVVVLVVLLLAIPLTVWLLQQTQIFSPKASEPPIQLVIGEDSCAISNDPYKASCGEFPVKLTSPLGPMPDGAFSCETSEDCPVENVCYKHPQAPGVCRSEDTQCAEAITRACRDDVCLDFSTPCHVPLDWEIQGPEASPSNADSPPNTASPSAAASPVCTTVASVKNAVPVDNRTIQGNYEYPAGTKITSINLPAQSGLSYELVGVQSTGTGQPLTYSSAEGLSSFSIKVKNATACGAFTLPFTMVNSCGTQMNDLIGVGSAGGYGQFCAAASPSSAVPSPSISLTISPESITGVTNVTINWATANLPAGTSCTNNWNSFLPINPNTSGSDVRSMNQSYTFTITCSNGTTASKQLTFTPQSDAGQGGMFMVNRKNILASFEKIVPEAAAQTAGFTVSGKVCLREGTTEYIGSGSCTEDDEPFANSTVYIYQESEVGDLNDCCGAGEINKASFTAQTDNNGNFSFTNIPAGKIRVAHYLQEGQIRITDDSFVYVLNQNLTYDFIVTEGEAENLPGTIYYQIAETEAGLDEAEPQAYLSHPIITDFAFSDPSPGVKQIWVRFTGPGNAVETRNISVEIVAPPPVVKSVACTVDLGRQNLLVTVNGERLGEGGGKVTVNTKDAAITSWESNKILAAIKPGENMDDGKAFKVVVVAKDNSILAEHTCLINTTVLSLGARLFCRAPGAFDVNNVKVTLVDEIGNKVDETVSIDKDGLIKNLKTKLTSGQLYAVSVKAPYSLRRNATFTAAEGTNVLSAEDDSNFILPVGDIAPVILSDGKINTLDRSEIVRQWSVLGTQTGKTGDFNRDTKVNSIDWACMRYDFNAEDQPIPAKAGLPGPSANPSSSPAAQPSASVSASASASPSASPLPSVSGQREAFLLLAPQGSSSYPVNTEFKVDVNIASPNEAANLFRARIKFDPGKLEVVRIEKGTEVSSWAEELFDNAAGDISLTAGKPNPGLTTQGDSEVRMASIVFKGKAAANSTSIELLPTSGIFSNSDNQNILEQFLSVAVAITSP